MPNKIMQSLVIDNDSSIHYKHTDINSDGEYYISLPELYSMFNADHKSIFEEKPNTLKSLSVITNTGTHKSLHQCPANEKPLFMKISNSDLRLHDSEILIAFNHNHSISKSELPLIYPSIDQPNLFNHQVFDIQSDINGFNNCVTINNSIKQSNNTDGTIETAELCCPPISMALSSYKQTGKKFYQGYIPSITQMMIIIKYMDMINYVFRYYKVSELNLAGKNWWTSSEYNETDAWQISLKKAYYYNNTRYLDLLKNITDEIHHACKSTSMSFLTIYKEVDKGDKVIIKHKDKQMPVSDNIDLNWKPNIDELYDLYKENPRNAFSYNTIDAISFIDSDLTEKSLHRKKEKYTQPKILKIKANNKVLLLSASLLTHDEDTNLKWEEVEEYCKNRRIIIRHGIRYIGYCPEIDELIIINQYKDMISYILKTMTGNGLLYGNYASLTEFDDYNVYILLNDKKSVVSKNEVFSVLPLFKFNDEPAEEDDNDRYIPLTSHYPWSFRHLIP